MPLRTPEQIVDVVQNRRVLFDLETDSLIRSAANRLTAKALFKLVTNIGDVSSEVAETFRSLLKCLPVSPYLIGLASRDEQSCADGPELPTEAENETKGADVYLRLVFRDEKAAYYQHPLFPNLEAPYILGSSRKRAGDVQHLRITLTSGDALQEFIESCRSNPHLLRVEQSTEEDFARAPSHGV